MERETKFKFLKDKKMINNNIFRALSNAGIGAALVSLLVYFRVELFIINLLISFLVLFLFVSLILTKRKKRI